MNMDYKEIEGGVYENTGADVQEIADDIVDGLKMVQGAALAMMMR